MALINIESIEKVVKSTHKKHTEVDASYSVISTEDGKIVQLDTYGSTDRKEKGKISQSIQFDKQSAAWFYALLKKEFDL